MPPKPRQNNFFGEGQGRKTGITLQDTGVRDEHGMETLDIFSSPEKAESKRSIDPRDGTIVTSEEMEIQQSSMPDPTETLTVRQVLSTKRTALPPKSRSPIKTALGSSPRRQSSMGPPARSQLEQNRRSAVRRLDFHDSQEGISTSSPEVVNGVPRGSEPSIYDIPGSPTGANGEIETSQEVEEGATDLPDIEADSALLPIADEEVENTFADREEIQQELPSSPPKRKNANKRKFVVEEAEAASEPRATKTQKNARRGARKPIVEVPVRTKRQTRASYGSSQLQEDNSVLPLEPYSAVDESVVEEMPPPPQRKKRGPNTKVKAGPARKAREPSIVEEEPSVVEPKKRGRPKRDISVLRDEPGPSMPPPQIKSKGRTPKERDANKKAPARKAPADNSGRSMSKAPTEISMVSGRTTQSTMSNVRQLLVRPTDGDDYKRSRFGRALRQPLAGWRGEKDNFSHNNTLIESVLTEEVTPVKVDRRRTNRRKRRQSTVYEEADVEELEEWEKDPGVLGGTVNVWDHDAENTRGEREDELAYAASSIQTNLVSGTEFKYTRICGIRFFNVGMVDLPPYAEKKRKNSRRMHMVFYVLRGPVQVTVGDNPEFTINSGGVWQVPRGNLYSIKNDSDTEAKVFFSQACRMRDEEEE